MLLKKLKSLANKKETNFTKSVSFDCAFYTVISMDNSMYLQNIQEVPNKYRKIVYPKLLKISHMVCAPSCHSSNSSPAVS